MIEDLIIIIPTHNRQHYLGRVVKYYSSFPCKVYICDSSKQKANVDTTENINYRWVPQSNFYGKVLDVLNETSAAFYALSPDDDFLKLETLIECYESMNENETFSFGIGKQISFKKGCYDTFYITNRSNRLQGINDINLEKRKYIQYFFQHYQNVLWSVYRKKVIKDAFISLNQCNYGNGNFIELTLSIEGLRNGHVYVSKKGLNYRESIEGAHWGNTTPSITYKNIHKNVILKKDMMKFRNYYKDDRGFAERCILDYLNITVKDRISIWIPQSIKKWINNIVLRSWQHTMPPTETYKDQNMTERILKAI